MKPKDTKVNKNSPTLPKKNLILSKNIEKEQNIKQEEKLISVCYFNNNGCFIYDQQLQEQAKAIPSLVQVVAQDQLNQTMLRTAAKEDQNNQRHFLVQQQVEPLNLQIKKEEIPINKNVLKKEEVKIEEPRIIKLKKQKKSKIQKKESKNEKKLKYPVQSTPKTKSKRKAERLLQHSDDSYQVFDDEDQEEQEYEESEQDYEKEEDDLIPIKKQETKSKTKNTKDCVVEKREMVGQDQKKNKRKKKKKKQRLIFRMILGQEDVIDSFDPFLQRCPLTIEESRQRKEQIAQLIQRIDRDEVPCKFQQRQKIQRHANINDFIHFCKKSKKQGKPLNFRSIVSQFNLPVSQLRQQQLEDFQRATEYLLKIFDKSNYDIVVDQDSMRKFLYDHKLQEQFLVVNEGLYNQIDDISRYFNQMIEGELNKFIPIFTRACVTDFLQDDNENVEISKSEEQFIVDRREKRKVDRIAIYHEDNSLQEMHQIDNRFIERLDNSQYARDYDYFYPKKTEQHKIFQLDEREVHFPEPYQPDFAQRDEDDRDSFFRIVNYEDDNSLI